jgi:hypothetical protein
VQGGGYWFTFLYKYCIISVFLRKHLPHPFGVLKKACCWLSNGHYLLPGYWASFTNGLLLLKWQSVFSQSGHRNAAGALQPSAPSGNHLF